MGIKVLRFSVGFGKPLISWHDKLGTEYVISWLPLGGYVKMLDEREGSVASTELHQAFNRKSLKARTAVVLAGPLCNLLFAVVLFWSVFLAGIPTLLPVLGPVSQSSPAARAGLLEGQQIVAVEEQSVDSWESVVVKIMQHLGEQDTIKLTVKNRQTHQEAMTTLRLDRGAIESSSNVLGTLGLKPFLDRSVVTVKRYGPLLALQEAFFQTKEYTVVTLLFVKKMVLGQVSSQYLSGPVSIAKYAGVSLSLGWVEFVSLMAIISISLGVINLLPIPMLDGGHLAYFLFEWVTKKPPSEKLLEWASKTGFAVLFCLMAVALYNDLLRL